MIRRRVLLWQIADLIRQLAWARQWWAAADPETYGPWADGQ